MRVGDILVSVDGKDVLGASLPAALAAIEAARRRVSVNSGRNNNILFPWEACIRPVLSESNAWSEDLDYTFRKINTFFRRT